MKTTIRIVMIIITTALISSCTGKNTSRPNEIAEADTTTVPDTGYTGIKKYFSGDYLIKEVTWRNGIKEGESRTFYKGGQLYQTFNYVNNLREDTARWYYLEGQVFRATPYRHDTIDGTQVQYYRTGRVKARLKYINGLRAPFLEEYTTDGKLVKGYPEITYVLEDNYRTSGKIRVNLAVSNNAPKVQYYIGEFANGVFDTTKCTRIKTTNGKNYVDLRKTEKQGEGFLNIIASVRTAFGNNYLTHKKIGLPYKDLK